MTVQPTLTADDCVPDPTKPFIMEVQCYGRPMRMKAPGSDPIYKLAGAFIVAKSMASMIMTASSVKDFDVVSWDETTRHLVVCEKSRSS